ncbi:MAG: glycosyltransferase family 4 protein [Kineosporiaceae bacterium]
MKVLMLTSGYLDINIGGVETYVYEVSRALRARGHEVVVVRISGGLSLRCPPDDVPLEVVTSGGRWTPSSETLRRLINGVRAARHFSTIERLAPDIWHFHDLSEAFPLAATARLRSNAKLVWTNHLGEFLVLAGSRPGRLVSRVLTRPYAAALAPSKELALQSGIAPPVRFKPNGYDPRRFTAPDPSMRAFLRRKLELPDDTTPVVLVPRRWAPNKGIRYLAEALAQWPEDAGPDPLVVFAGGGSSRYRTYQEDVATLLKESRVPVRVLGEITGDRMPELVKAADLTVIPSLREATSLSAIESMGCGVPVVATSVGGLVDLAELMPAEAMTLVPPANSAALMSALVDRLAIRQWDGESAALLAKETAENFSWRTIADDIEQTYLKVLS